MALHPNQIIEGRTYVTPKGVLMRVERIVGRKVIVTFPPEPPPKHEIPLGRFAASVDHEINSD